MNRCELGGFEHAWEDVSTKLVYKGFPPESPDIVRRCKNCGRIEELVWREADNTFGVCK